MSRATNLYNITINEIEKTLETKETIYEKAFFLQQESRTLLDFILASNTKQERENLEMYLQSLSSVKAKYVLGLLSNKTITEEEANLFFPSINDPYFNNKIADISRFSQYQVPEIQDRQAFFSERNPDFSRTPSQNFVASFITPDTPYNGILLWHGVGAGKTCAALGIAETFLNNHNELSKKVLILTPSEQLHSEWKSEIFNLSKEISKDTYNIYLTNGGDLDYYTWLLKGSPEASKCDDTKPAAVKRMPISNIQCTGNKYNPLKTRVVEDITKDTGKNKKKLERLIKQKIQENYDFETYNITVNKYEKQERNLFFNKSKHQEGKLVKYIINHFSNRVIIMDEIHRVREKTDGTGKKNREANLKKGPGLIYAEKSTVYVALKPNIDPVLATVLSVEEDSKTNQITYQLELHDDTNKIVDGINQDQVWARTTSMMEQKMMILKMIAKYAVNTKLVLASATPMYSTASEILDILDILLLNDSRPMTVKTSIFKDDYQLKGESGEAERELAKRDLITASKGYISYIRGVNPAIFPIRLDPTSYILSDDDSALYPLASLGYEPRPIYSFTPRRSGQLERGQLKPSEWIKDPCLYRDIMSYYQLACWVGICDQGFGSGSKKNNNWAFSGLLQGKAPTHASIITFPLLDNEEITSILNNEELERDTIEKLKICYGQKGFDHTFNRVEVAKKEKEKDKKKRQVMVKWNYRQEIDPEFLKLLEPGPESNPGSEGISQEIYGINFRGLYKYSSKLANIVRLINSCQGIVFIYSEYVVDGVNMMAMALEANGYYRYTPGQTWNSDSLSWQGENHNLLVDDLMSQGEERRNYQGTPFHQLQEDDPLKIQGRYIMLKGEDMGQKSIDDLIAAAKAENNIEGQEIKIIIGSKKVREGFSLKAVRQIHILDPWYHLNAIDQSTGRGIRNYSHGSLALENRNVTVFLHTASLPDLNDENLPALSHLFHEILPDEEEIETSVNEVSEQINTEIEEEVIQPGVSLPLTLLESSDEYLYRIAYKNSRAIAKIQRYLQQYALDCKLNIHGNMFPTSLFDEKGINPYPIMTSQNKSLPDFKLGNRDDSWKCDFSSCRYKCKPDNPGRLTGLRSYEYYIELLPITNTILDTAKKTFKNIFSKQLAITLPEIIKLMSVKKISNKISYLAIEQVVKNREQVYDSNYRRGYIIFRHKKGKTPSFYIFQPIWLPISSDHNLLLEDQQDESIAPILRQIPPPNTANQITLTKESPDEDLEGKIEKETKSLAKLDCQDQELSLALITSLEKYFIIILAILNSDLAPYYPNKPNNDFGGTLIYPKGKPHSCQEQCTLPTVQDLSLMAGFSILDPLPDTDEYVLLTNVCQWACFRLCAEQLDHQGDWVNYTSKVTSLKMPGKYLLSRSPSLKLVAYYFYLGDLPENIIKKEFQENPIAIGNKVHIKETFKMNSFDGLVDSLPEPGDTTIYVKDISNGVRKLVDVKQVIPLIDRQRRVYFERVKVQVKQNGVTKTTDKILPTRFRLLKIGKSASPQQIFYQITYHLVNLDDQDINCQIKEDRSEVINQYKMTLNDVTPSESSAFYGYSNIQSKTGKCNYTSVEIFTNFTREEVLKYSLTCFYFKNLLQKREGMGGCCALQSGKQKKVEIINTILPTTNSEPYLRLFSRYEGKKPIVPGGDSLVPVEKVMNGVDQEIKKITLCQRTLKSGNPPTVIYQGGLDNSIKDPATKPIVTLELMLLLRFFRFVNKGYCPSDPLNTKTWYLRKDEAQMLLNK